MLRNNVCFFKLILPCLCWCQISEICYSFWSWSLSQAEIILGHLEETYGHYQSMVILANFLLQISVGKMSK